jgi:hypothetical protein
LRRFLQKKLQILQGEDAIAIAEAALRGENTPSKDDNTAVAKEKEDIADAPSDVFWEELKD